MLLGEMQIIESPIMADPIYKQTFIPKSKKKRIQKKARKLYTKFMGMKPWDKVIFNFDKIICHPEIARKIKESSEFKEYQQKSNLFRF